MTCLLWHSAIGWDAHVLHLVFRFLLPPSRGASASPDNVKHGPFSKNSSFLLHVCKHAHLFFSFFFPCSQHLCAIGVLSTRLISWWVKTGSKYQNSGVKCTDFVTAEAAKVSQVYFATTVRGYVRTFAALTFWGKRFLFKFMSLSSFIKVGHPSAGCLSALRCYCRVQEAWRDKNSSLLEEASPGSVIDTNCSLHIHPPVLYRRGPLC